MSSASGSSQPDSWLWQYEKSARLIDSGCASLASDIDRVKAKACTMNGPGTGETKACLENLDACLRETSASASRLGPSCKALLETVSAIQLGSEGTTGEGLQDSKAAVKKGLSEVESHCRQSSEANKEVQGKLSKAIDACSKAISACVDEVEQEQIKVAQAEADVNANENQEKNAVERQKQEADVKRLEAAHKRAEMLRLLSTTLGTLDSQLSELATKTGVIASEIEQLQQKAQSAMENTDIVFGLQDRYGKSISAKDKEIERLKALLAQSEATT